MHHRPTQGEVMKKTVAVLSAAAVALTLAGCANAGSTVKAELEKRGFTDVTVVQENSTVATAWAGAPGTSCRFLFKGQVKDQGAGDIVLVQRSSSGDAEKDINIPEPNLAMLKDAANWPQIASCWSKDAQPPAANK